MNPRTPKQTSQARRWATISALALLCVVSLGGCASSNPQIETSKQQGDNSTAADQTTTQSGFLNFAKSTQAVGLAGGSLLTVIVLLMTLNYRVLMKMIPLVNADDHRQNIAFDPGFGSPSLPGSQERKTGGANLSAQNSAGNV